jgi:hypothetical protein
MEKIKQNKGIVLAVLALVMVLFYWTEVRPSSIKSECSWFNEVTEADPGVTPEQASENKKNIHSKMPFGAIFQ